MPACLLLMLPITSALLRPRPAPVCMPTRHVQRTRTLLPQADHVQRTRQLFVAQLADWTPRVDEVSGATYYYNEQTDQSQWASPQAAAAQQDYGDQAAWQPPQGSGPQDADQVLWRFNGRRLCSGGRYSLHSSMVKQAAHLTICRSRSPSACSGPRWRPDTPPRCRGESCGSGALPPAPLRSRIPPPSSMQAQARRGRAESVQHAQAEAHRLSQAGNGLVPRGQQRHADLGRQGGDAVARARWPVVRYTLSYYSIPLAKGGPWCSLTSRARPARPG